MLLLVSFLEFNSSITALITKPSSCACQWKIIKQLQYDLLVAIASLEWGYESNCKSMSVRYCTVHMVHGIVGCYRIQGLLKGEKRNLYPDFFRFGLLAKSLQPCMTVTDDDDDDADHV